MLPPLIEIVKDIEKYCPDAVFLNYTNPMAMVCRALQEISGVRTSGLCHSVQGTAAMLCGFIGAPRNEVTYLCAGLNHQAHYLRFDWNGKDAIPLIRKAITENEEIYNKEQVRNEMFLHLGYYATESSGHNSEYNWWFRKRPDLIEKYCTHGTNWNPGHDALARKEAAKNETTEERHTREFGNFDVASFSLNRGEEYAAYIFNAIFGDGAMFKFNGNVRNFGLIDNLPEGACVEVPILAGPNGLKLTHIGFMPRELALLNNIESQTEEMVVEAYLNRDKSLVYKAVYYDPYTAAKLSLDEMDRMVDQMFEACGKYQNFW